MTILQLGPNSISNVGAGTRCLCYCVPPIRRNHFWADFSTPLVERRMTDMHVANGQKQCEIYCHDTHDPNWGAQCDAHAQGLWPVEA